MNARVTRFRIAKVRQLQMIAPIAPIASVLVRRFPSPVTYTLCFGFMALGLYLAVAMRKRFGSQALRFRAHKLELGDSEYVLRRNQGSWYVDGRVARFYRGEMSWKLKVSRRDADAFRTALTETFGEPPRLERRGSPRARRVAVAVSGVSAFALFEGIYLDVVALYALGTVGAVLGLATLGALSQKIVR